MIERDACYFCTSAFQIISIIGIAISKNEKADLYIDPQFFDAKNIAKRLEKITIFENIIIIDREAIFEKYMSFGPGVLNHLQIANTYFHVNKIAEMILLKDVVYKRIYLSSKAYLPRMVQLYYISKGIDFNVYYFDDGAGSYDDNRAYKISFPDKMLRFLLFGKKSIRIDYERFLFSEKIYRSLNCNYKGKVFTIDRFWENGSNGFTRNWKESINELFAVQSDLQIKEKVIILDQPKDEMFNESDIKCLNDIYDRVVKRVGYDNVIVKKHPRSDAKEFKNIKYFESTGIPFELYCLNENMSDKVIISHSSTAVATPKVLFNQEPKVIVLTKLMKLITGEKDLFEKYFKAVKDNYNSPGDFLIPENMEEMNEIIKALI